ncbi:MAG: hypothetical protein PHH70_04290 [Candidatus Gracilibacteria bacterium]|nr:hypothetical protein [Candidatus Gracilibacteria bacterium]
MKFIETEHFLSQIHSLGERFPKIGHDWQDFKETFSVQLGISLGEGVYKFRCKNSSIPTGKSGGFRIIIKVFENKVLPFMIYSKTDISNVSKAQIVNALKKVLEEL